MQAVEHVKQYVNIINYRMSTNISFMSLLESDVEDILLPKMILQPLVENSIMHGFNIQNGNDGMQITPEIKIFATLDKGCLYITVQDNGKGIDIENAKNCILSTEIGEGHVGLRNVYKRLQYNFENSVEVEFSSIPFYQNCVKIIIEYNET